MSSAATAGLAVVKDRKTDSEGVDGEYSTSKDISSIHSNNTILKKSRAESLSIKDGSILDADDKVIPESFKEILRQPNEEVHICRFMVICGEEEFYSIHAQEPWPANAKLYQTLASDQIIAPDMANCLAVQTFLKMCSLNFDIVCKLNAEDMSPTGRVPFLKCDRYLVAELEPIVAFVNNKGISLSSHLTIEQKSDIRAYMALIKNVLENAESYLSWYDNHVYNTVTRKRYNLIYPWPLSAFRATSKRRAILRRLQIYGWDRKTRNEVFNEVMKCCGVLSKRLGNLDYFFGSKPTELDAAVFAHMFALAASGVLMSLSKSHLNLVRLSKKIANEHFRMMTDKVEKVFDMIDSVKFDKSVYYDNKEVGKLQSSSNGSGATKTLPEDSVGDSAEVNNKYMTGDHKYPHEVG